MLRFELKTENRKDLVARLAELTGTKARYMGMPSAAYQVGDYTVEKDGTLVIEDGAADSGILRQLADEGLIDGSALAGDTNDESADVNLPTDENMEMTQATVENEYVAEKPVEYGEAAEEVPAAENKEAAETAEETEPVAADEIVTADAEEFEVEGEESEADEVVVDLPLAGHTGRSLRNLVNMVFSRAALINRAIGSSLRVDKELVEAIKSTEGEDVKSFIDTLDEYEIRSGRTGMEGITIDPEEQMISFSTLPYTEDGDRIRAWMQLFSGMSKMAKEQKRIQAKAVDMTNEKYSFRCWLLRLGMNGDEFKGTRRILMENLSGHSAFRTPEEAERAKAKLAEKRREQKEAAAEAVPETEAEASAEFASAIEEALVADGVAEENTEETAADTAEENADPE